MQDIQKELTDRFGEAILTAQPTKDGIPTLWISAQRTPRCLDSLTDVSQPYRMLYDLTAIDERSREHRQGQPDSDFTLVYHLLSFDRNQDVRLKVPLKGEYPSLHSVSNIYKNANWYEREVYDMFGIEFEGHPHLERLLMPLTWEGHPLRKEHPARGTEIGPFQLPPEKKSGRWKPCNSIPSNGGWNVTATIPTSCS